MTIHDILETVLVHSVIGDPLYDFGSHAMIDDETHRKHVLREIRSHMTISDDSEIEALSMVEHFITSAPVGVDLNKAVVDHVGNYVPDGWSYV